MWVVAQRGYFLGWEA
ncbi:hypothetical protein S7711_10272 [Stachybotrys chartarum IBT 7711]|uniref:Uncharacterized protein n=1 Tax=Stachybotrys chartarum (strain CBS 109288 / IBT 7711) TaxID=1280523 RepID=A0A084B7C1_STACB|nr:hypothetical protein S7711_10272 [Stachybotrys chartarum IBT 7711]